jgi:hypothetical protein
VRWLNRGGTFTAERSVGQNGSEKKAAGGGFFTVTLQKSTNEGIFVQKLLIPG